MFCKNCGKMLNDGASFCEGCGARVTDQIPYTPSQPYYSAAPKSIGLGIILTFLINGAGQMYVGKWARGLLIFTLNCILGVSLVVITLDHIYYDIYGNLFYDFSTILGTITAISLIAFALFVLSLYDTYTLINKYNEHVRRNGNPPW